MSYIEAMQWTVYRRQRGSLHVGLRFEAHIAQAMEVLCAAIGVKKEDGEKFKAADFMTHGEDETAEDGGLSFESALAAFQRIGHGDE